MAQQGLELLWAAMLGVGLGVVYDLGRALRRQRQGWTPAVDLLFALALFLALGATAVYTGGLRGYQCIGILLGIITYFVTASPYVVAAFRRVLRILGSLKRKILEFFKKIPIFLRKTSKKHFPFSSRWSRIKENSSRRRTAP